MTEASIKHGNFDSLAGDYAQYRPGYAPSIVPAVLSLVGRPAREVDAADIGAGTGIWTRMLAAQDLRSVTAIEPSDEMGRYGLLTTQEHNIVWRRGTAEETGLPPRAYDLVTMASSFHWTDFDKATAEFGSLHSDHPKDIRVKKNYIQLLILKNRFDEAGKPCNNGQYW